MNLDKQIAETKAQLEKLLEKKRLLDQRSPAELLADVLHSSFCRYNHIDGCSWEYETWQNYTSSVRNEYLEKAEILLKFFNGDAERAIQVINIIRGY